jgi:hypothetical protein
MKRGAHSTAQELGARLRNAVEIVRPCETAAAGEHDFRIFQTHALGLGLHTLNKRDGQRRGIDDV